MNVTLAVRISAAGAHARAMAHRYGHDSREARDAREELADLQDEAWYAQFGGRS